jgi:hypothetical protein
VAFVIRDSSLLAPHSWVIQARHEIRGCLAANRKIRAGFRNPGSTGVRHDTSGARRFCSPCFGEKAWEREDFLPYPPLFPLLIFGSGSRVNRVEI